MKRLIIGYAIMCIGFGLTLSAFVPMPKEEENL